MISERWRRGGAPSGDVAVGAGAWTAVHHAFTSPPPEFKDSLESAPGAALADEIERSARQFFASVYSMSNIKRRTLRPHEAAFWTRLKRVRRAQRKAKRDRKDLYHVILCLQQRLPASCCEEIVRMAI